MHKGRSTVLKSYALDLENAERLWQVSEQLVGETLPLS
jgi:hypothetical protein